MEAAAAIELQGIQKSFGNVHAVRDVSLRIEKGAITGIVGENGAGKSTLMSILYGLYHADAGEIRVDGSAVRMENPRDAIAHGIGMVHQHFMLVGTFTVLENLVLGAEGGPLLAVGLAAARAELARLAREYGLSVDPDALVADLSVGEQQRVEILKVLFRGARILILDEPSAVLTPQETDQLFRILATLKARGVTVVLITHKLREIMAATDHVYVMRQGQIVADRRTADTNPEELAELMVGRKVLMQLDKAPKQPGDVLLQAEHLTLIDARGVRLLDDVGLELRAGEIVGIAGVSGNGQTELLQVLSGIRAPTGGRLTVCRRVIDPGHPSDPAEMRDLGLAHVPEDRLRQGMVAAFQASETSILGYQELEPFCHNYLMDGPAVGAHCAALMERFDVRPRAPGLRSSSFSGGNQQKLVLAREMARAPKVLLVGQPTRGVDIGAIEFIHRELVKARDQGCAVLVVSVELDEILSLADRILVMFAGKIVGEVPAGRADERTLGLMMAGAQPAPSEVEGTMSAPRRPLPAWAEIAALPLINIALAFVTVGIIVRIIGVDPLHALRLLVVGAIGSSESIGYTLYYATNFTFTGLAVAVAFHAGLFNIGGEGQAYIGGLGCGLAILAFDHFLPAWLMIPLAIAAAALFGAAWAAVPAWLQAWRGSHIVITTIMFNFVASALMVYLMVNVLIAPGSMTPQSRNFAPSGKLPSMHDVLGAVGIQVAPSALNLSIVLAVLCCVGVWVFLWHTPWGYELRTMGHNPEAAVYAGTSIRRMTMLAMCLSGALAGFVGVNELMGVHQRIVLDFPAGYGFAGIAVALMGRSHPVGIVLAALLFGALQQGGAELAFEIPTITRETVVVIQGLIILFSGALAHLPRPWLQSLLALRG